MYILCNSSSKVIIIIVNLFRCILCRRRSSLVMPQVWNSQYMREVIAGPSICIYLVIWGLTIQTAKMPRPLQIWIKTMSPRCGQGTFKIRKKSKRHMIDWYNGYNKAVEKIAKAVQKCMRCLNNIYNFWKSCIELLSRETSNSQRFKNWTESKTHSKETSSRTYWSNICPQFSKKSRNSFKNVNIKIDNFCREEIWW